MPTIIDELAELLQQSRNQKALGFGMKHDTATSPITVGFNHGPGGLLTFPGVDNTVFHTIMGNRSILGILPSMPSVFVHPTYFTVTGVTDDTGDEKEDPCDDAPIGGLMKGCMLTSVFGRYERATPELEIGRLGQRNDRADPMDLTLVGSPIASAGIFNTGAQDASAPGDVFTNEVSRKFWERNISLWRLISRQIWTGHPVNNSGGGGYKEMTGLSTLVNTGHVDAETGQACPSMDSYVMNFNYMTIDNPLSDIVAALTNMYHHLYTLAEGTGVLPVNWVLAMRPQLFYHLTAIWPCSYLAYRCGVAPGMTGPMSANIDAQDALNMVFAMRNGRYLPIDGVNIPVILDDSIPESDGNSSSDNFSAGCFSSDIYFLPLSVTGGRSSLFLEYFDYGNPSAQSAIQNMGLYRSEGAFLTWPRQTNTCIQWQTRVEPRLVLRTPWLAGRLQNVVYCPIDQVRQPFPDSPYYINGGRTEREGPSLFSMWQS